MSLEEISKQYGVTTDVLIRFIEIGIFEIDDFTTQNGFYKPYVIRRVNECLCLSFVGLSLEAIKVYIHLQEEDKNTVKEQVQLLNTTRVDCLKTMHCTKRKSDCIDDILYDCKKIKK